MLINILGGEICYLRDSQEVPAAKLSKLYIDNSNGAVFCRQLRGLGDVLSVAWNNPLQWNLCTLKVSHRTSARQAARTEKSSGSRSLSQSSWRDCCKDPGSRDAFHFLANCQLFCSRDLIPHTSIALGQDPSKLGSSKCPIYMPIQHQEVSCLV